MSTPPPLTESAHRRLVTPLIETQPALYTSAMVTYRHAPVDSVPAPPAESPARKSEQP